MAVTPGIPDSGGGKTAWQGICLYSIQRFGHGGLLGSDRTHQRLLFRQLCPGVLLEQPAMPLGSGHCVHRRTGGSAFELFVARPLEWQVGTETTVYSYEVYNENDHYLVGFSTKMEKDAFKSLIQVKGIGPKTAINALSATTPDELFRAISASNTSYLKKLPGIGPKAASQIILDLKGKLASPTNKNANDERYEDVRAALKSMGFKVKDIDTALSSINEPNLSTEDILRAALLKLRGSRK